MTHAAVQKTSLMHSVNDDNIVNVVMSGSAAGTMQMADLCIMCAMVVFWEISQHDTQRPQNCETAGRVGIQVQPYVMVELVQVHS